MHLCWVRFDPSKKGDAYSKVVFSTSSLQVFWLEVAIPKAARVQAVLFRSVRQVSYYTSCKSYGGDRT